jgi:hypothetical protein
MRKLSGLLLVIGMLVCCTADTAYAQKGGSSRPASSGSSSRPGSSYSSGGSKSYSSGGSSKPATTSGSSYNSNAGKSYSSGGSTPAPAKSTPAPVAGSGGKSYSSGGTSAPAKPSVTVAPKVAGTTPGSSYSAGNKTYTPVSSNPSGSTKPKGGAFDGNAAQAKQREESKANYIKGAEPKSTYTTPAGKEAKIDTSSKSVTTVRTMSHTTYVTRDTRVYNAYSHYYGRPLVVYNDPYNSFFWYWMLDRSLDERAMWAYHHQHEMDAARYREMVTKDAALEARIRQLEAQNKGVRDVSYTPRGIDPDLQYSDDFVDAAYNPHAEHDNTPPPVAATSSGSSGVGKFFYYVFMTLLVGVGIWFVVYLVFLKNF